MKYPSLLIFALLFSSLIHCSAETEDGGVTDTRSNWQKSCDSDSECGEVLSCLCGVCSVSCEDDEQCSETFGVGVCGSPDTCAQGERICLASDGEGADGESGGTGGVDGAGASASTGGHSPSGGATSTGGVGEGTGGEASGGDGGVTGLGGAGGEGASCLAEGQECRRVELGEVVFEEACCGGSSCAQLELSNPTTDVYSCKRDFTPCPDNCQVQQATGNCTSGETFKIIWACQDANPPAEVLSDCVDMATGLPRWCCPETTLPHCVPAP